MFVFGIAVVYAMGKYRTGTGTELILEGWAGASEQPLSVAVSGRDFGSRRCRAVPCRLLTFLQRRSTISQHLIS